MIVKNIENFDNAVNDDVINENAIIKEFIKDFRNDDILIIITYFINLNIDISINKNVLIILKIFNKRDVSMIDNNDNILIIIKNSSI